MRCRTHPWRTTVISNANSFCRVARTSKHSISTNRDITKPLTSVYLMDIAVAFFDANRFDKTLHHYRLWILGLNTETNRALRGQPTLPSPLAQALGHFTAHKTNVLSSKGQSCCRARSHLVHRHGVS